MTAPTENLTHALSFASRLVRATELLRDHLALARPRVLRWVARTGPTR